METDRLGRPDVVVVVMDCMRASDFGMGEAFSNMQTPFLSSLDGRLTRFDRAVSPAPWTVPSHASLLSGRYPWADGVHARGNLRFGQCRTWLPSMLQSAGYRTFALSANPLLDPAFEFTRGFSKAAWAAWWESFLRFGRSRPSSVCQSGEEELSGPPGTFRDSVLDRFLHSRMQDAFRFAAFVDGASKLSQRLRTPEPGFESAVAPWIETTLAEWLSDTPREIPIFAFINLVEAHEPYFATPRSVSGVRPWIRFARTRQDYLRYLNAEWAARPGEMELLHSIYAEQVRTLDLRLERIAATLRSSGRWDNTLFVVTSDHGQAFGEHNMLFHMMRSDETLLRIPLVVRFPGTSVVSMNRQWVSLVDVAPTVASAAGLPPVSSFEGEPLQSLSQESRASPVLACSDGIVWSRDRGRFSRSTIERLDRPSGVAYFGDYKVIVDGVSSETRAYDVVSDPAERHDIWDGGRTDLCRLQSIARTVARSVMAAGRPTLSEAVEERLQSWGYV